MLGEAGGALVQAQTFTYDAAGRVLSASDLDEAYILTNHILSYDAGERLTAKVENGTNTAAPGLRWQPQRVQFWWPRSGARAQV